MARGQSHVQRVSFVGGLNTEANPLTQKEDTLQSVSNYELKRNGDMLRRLGIDREDGYAETDTGYASGADKEYVSIREFFWDNPGGDLSKEFAVVQVGWKLYFMDTSSSSPSANVLSIDLNSEAAVAEAPIAGQSAISFASVSGFLVIVSDELRLCCRQDLC
jgi:hypothetical protein